MRSSISYLYKGNWFSPPRTLMQYPIKSFESRRIPFVFPGVVWLKRLVMGSVGRRERGRPRLMGRNKYQTTLHARIVAWFVASLLFIYSQARLIRLRIRYADWKSQFWQHKESFPRRRVTDMLSRHSMCGFNYSVDWSDG